MRLKPAILVQMSREELKAVCDTLELEDVDRRSADDMRRTLSRRGRARPELLLETLSEAQVKAVCDAVRVESTGRRSALIERLLTWAQEGGDRAEEPASAGGRKSPPTLDELRAIGPPRKRGEKRVTRYLFDQFSDPATPETGHTALMSSEETEVTVPMDNGWSQAIEVGKLPQSDRAVVVDMDPSADPVLFWAGKRNRRQVPVLPLQRNEVVSESRIAQVIERARRRAVEKDGPPPQAAFAFADLERSLREKGKDHRVEFYTHDEGWKNKLICGDSLHVMESLLHYENLGGKAQMIYIDPPYGVSYNTNFQQRVDSTKNDARDTGDDVLTIKAYHDTWSLGIHSYVSYLQERLYLCREMLAASGSLFVQISDKNVHLVRTLLDEVFGRQGFCSQITFQKTGSQETALLGTTVDYLLWYARDRAAASSRYRQLYLQRKAGDLSLDRYDHIETPDRRCRRLTASEVRGEAPIPDGRRFRATSLLSDGETSTPQEFVFEGKVYVPKPGNHWKTPPARLAKLAEIGRILVEGSTIQYKRYADDFGYVPINDRWESMQIGRERDYVVQTAESVIERCIQMCTQPGDLVFDPTCGSGTSAFCAERLGRRWITCDTSRVAVNVARKRLLAGVFAHYATRDGNVSSDFLYKTTQRITLESLAKGLEAETVKLFSEPLPDVGCVRVCGPFEVLTLGRYSVEDWKGYVAGPSADSTGEPAKLENYIEVICRLYRKEAAVQGASGFVHAIAESGKDRIAISVGPVTGRVSGKQVNDAVQDALASGLLEVHLLGWAFEANVGEVKAQLERRGRVKVELVMIRPDTLAEGLKITHREMLFSPLAIPDISIEMARNGGDQKQAIVRLSGVALFNRRSRKTEYRAADSGYVSAWYLDEDYDGDCFVDCQMFFDLKKTPNFKATLKLDVDPGEWKLQTESQPFPVRGYKRIAVKVVDVYGNESTVVRDLA